jgi:hypothetical protein
MYLRIIGVSASSVLLVCAAEYTRRLCAEKAASINGPFLPDVAYEKLRRQINILHPVSMLFWFLSFSPLLLMPRVLQLGREYLLKELGIGVIVAAAFWIGKHFELKWARRWITDPLTLMRGIVLAVCGMLTICCLYLLLSDPAAAKREIRNAFKAEESSKGDHHEH